MKAPVVLYGITVGISVQTLLRGQLAWLVAQGWEVHVACSPGDALDESAAREGFIAHSIPMSRSLNPISDLVALVAWLRLLRKLRPDVVNVSSPKAALLGALAARLMRVPRRVYVVRGLRLEGVTGPLRPLLWLVERLTVALSTDVLVVSRSLGTAMRDQHLLGRRPARMVGSGGSNGVDAAAVRSSAAAGERDDLRRQLSLPDDRLVVGYVGRVVADKGIETLLEGAAAAECGPTLLLVGSVDEPELALAIERSPLTIVHVPWTPDVWRYYSAMDVLCLPTLREGFPNVVLEAAAAGVPAIATDATGAVDAVVHGVTGLTIAVGDSAGLAAAIDELAGDPEQRRRLGAAARERASAEFEPERIWAGVAATMRGDTDSDIVTI